MAKKQTIKRIKKTKAKKAKAGKVKVKTKVRVKPKTKPKPKIKLKPKPKKRVPLTLREKKIQDIRKKLMAQREALLTGAVEALNELPGQTVFPDLGDQASAETDRSFMLRLRGREQRLLKKIEDAIDRIDNGVFGICDKCGEEIDIRRLEARPVTTMCIECKIQQEEEEKLMEM
jgi:DnaK suppressor protein